MRTTLDIDDDILQAAKELARAEKKTAGQVLSELARKGLTQAAASRLGFAEEPAPPFVLKDGWYVFTNREGLVVTKEQVDRLIEEADFEDAGFPAAKKGRVSVRALLDVNVLMALFDVATSIMAAPAAGGRRNRSTGWASCPLTQNGFAASSQSRATSGRSHCRQPCRALAAQLAEDRTTSSGRTISPSPTMPALRPQPHPRAQPDHRRLPPGPRREERRPARHLRSRPAAQGRARRRGKASGGLVSSTVHPRLNLARPGEDLGKAKNRHRQRQDAARLSLRARRAGRARLRSRVPARADAAGDAAARRVRRQVHDRLPQGVPGELVHARQAAPMAAATARSTTSASTPASRCRTGAARAGSIPTIRAAGSSGTAATTWAAACRRRTRRQIKRWKAIRRHVRQIEKQLRAGRPVLPPPPAPGAAALGLRQPQDLTG